VYRWPASLYTNWLYETAIEISDEPGCSEASHGRLYFVEKHGYTKWSRSLAVFLAENSKSPRVFC